ncbi:sugar fermentation stimulation protein [Thermaerobacter subterraneus DSM 13965]|uniref:Sugar fermentation stimulation protein n=1 Tax=Thermaerobacter subterraneus DSM 13965 TaxID=867903 RepID=K6Q3Y0_9FIRM|nr:sugar fermentation stimulation protein [Thermaerobacter subterraneus DSM 13965]
MSGPVNVALPWPSPLVPVIILRRLNRFAVEAVPASPGTSGPAGGRAGTDQPRGRPCGPGHAAGRTVAAAVGGAGDGAAGKVLRLHLPNSGRMAELLVPGTPGLAWIPAAAPQPEQQAGGTPAASRRQARAPLGPPQPLPGPAAAAVRQPPPPSGTAGRAGSAAEGGRRTAGDLLLVSFNGRWVSVDARMPNRLFAAALDRRALLPFAAYRRWQTEVPWGAGRLDFRLEGAGEPLRPCLVETKSCNLVEDGTALFPDAPTARGARHLEELAQAVRQGWRAAVVWFVQRDDAARLAPHRRADPHFAAALARARAAGVEAYAYRCRVSPAGISLLGPIPVVPE